MSRKKINDDSLRISGDITGEFLIPTVNPDSPTEPASCTVNGILEYLDSILGSCKIPEYSDSSPYFKNQIVRRNGDLYRFESNKVRTEWDAVDAVETDIRTELMARNVETERVIVSVSVEDDGFSIDGITVACQTKDGTFLEQTDSDGTCSFEVEKGKVFSIAVNDVEGYDGLAPMEFFASKSERYVSIHYIPVELSEDRDVEHVTVIMMAGNAITPSALSAAKGMMISYFINGDNNMYKAVIDGYGNAVFDVPKGSTYTIIYPQLDNYTKPSSQTFIASKNERTLCSKFAFSTDNSNSFLLVAEDGKEYSIDSFSSLSVRPNIVAFHINTPELRTTPSGLNDGKMCDFYIKSNIEVGSYAMQNASASITDVTTTTTNNTGNANSCHFKYTGVLDTKRIKEFMTQIHTNTWYNSPAWVNMVSERTLEINGIQMKAFILSFGQLWALRQLNSEFISAQQLMHGGVIMSLASGDWWSCTQYNSSNMWRLSSGAAGNTAKTTACNVITAYN